MKVSRLPPIRYDSEIMSASALAQQIGWGQRERGIPGLWKRSGGAGVLVIVLDTGEPNHPDLPKSVFAHNMTRSPLPDVNSHHTHCAGIIAAKNDDAGVVGWAPECDLAHIKVLGDNGSAPTSWITAGIRKGIEEWKKRKADYVGCVFSLSVGGPYDEDQDRAVTEANEAGIIVVAAAGNSGPNAGVDSPGDSRHALATASYRRDGGISTFSSGGPEVDFAMPGEGILSTVPGGWQVQTGTSMAAPALAAVVADALSSRPHQVDIRNYDGMKSLLSQNADDRGQPGKDNRFGIGVPSPENAIRDQEYWFF